MTDPLLAIPEFSHLQEGRGLIRIPMEQDVPFTPRVRALVDTPEFQRLKHISQLGLAATVYPGATHSRFEHALGVYHNALKYLSQLHRHERFRHAVDQHLSEVLIASALLHDLGHWPFCHPIEDMDLPGLAHHEAFAAEFLAPDRELTRVLRSEWNIHPEEILEVLSPRSDSHQFRLIRSILSGPIDIDKMDYLDRDSLHAGVPYGRNFDRNRLIQSLVVNEAGDGLAITDKGKTAAELMVFARYVMFSEVYWHHAVRSATCMFATAFFHLHPRLDLPAFFRGTEADAIRQLQDAANNTPAAQLLDGVFGTRRRLHKRACEYSYYQSPEIYESLAGRPFSDLVTVSDTIARELSRIVGQPVHGTDLLIDAPPPHREVQFKVDIYFVKEQTYRPLQEVSPVVNALANQQFDDYVKRVRLYVHPRLIPTIAGLGEFETLVRQAARHS